MLSPRAGRERQGMLGFPITGKLLQIKAGRHGWSAELLDFKDGDVFGVHTGPSPDDYRK